MPLPTIHPGKVLLGELLERDWTLSQLAGLLAIDREILRDFLEGTADLTPELAARIAKLIDTSEEFWLNMQAGYDAEHQDKPETVVAE